MNKVILTGRLGADPVSHDGENGKFVTYTLANSEWSKNGEITNWVDVTAFSANAEFALKNLSKGQKVLIEGRLSVRPYEKNGEKRKSVNVIVSKQEFADSKKDKQADEGFIEISDELVAEMPFC